MLTRNRMTRLAFALLLPLLISSCASTVDGPPEPTSVRVDQCKPGDIEIAGSAQCLQDDSACYALLSGGYCTGPRSSICPTGSSEVKSGASCPDGQRCFSFSESLECVVDTEG